jgi:hypothetical protein
LWNAARNADAGDVTVDGGFLTSVCFQTARQLSRHLTSVRSEPLPGISLVEVADASRAMTQTSSFLSGTAPARKALPVLRLVGRSDHRQSWVDFRLEIPAWVAGSGVIPEGLFMQPVWNHAEKAIHQDAGREGPRTWPANQPPCREP